MFNETHRQVGRTMGIGVAIALSPPLYGAAVIALTAQATAMVPDNMEKWFFVRRRNHREWTHWLVVTILFGVILGALIYGIGYGASTWVMDHMHAHTAREYASRRALSNALYQGGYVMGILIGIGAVCGAMSHSLIDACTHGGVPLLGPFSKEKKWLVPLKYRTEVGDKKKEAKGKPFQPTKIEKRWRLLMNMLTFIMIFIIVYPYVGPQIIEFIHKYSHSTS